MAIGAAKWASHQRLYMELREAGLPIVGVRYEDLVADPEANMRRILRHCGLPQDWAVASVRALDVDSQLNTPYSSATLRRHAVPQYSDTTVRAAVDEVCDHYGMPRFADTMYVAQGTVTSGGQTCRPSNAC